MGTRSVIVVTGEKNYSGNQTVRFYKHYDGYPTGNLPIIAKALCDGAAKIAEHQAELKTQKPGKFCTELFEGLLIGAATDVYGISARVEEKYEEEFRPEHLGNQSDLEWLYLVDLKEKTVEVFGGKYTGNLPQSHYRKGSVKPEKWLENLRPEYVDAEREQLNCAIRDIEQAGFKLNPKKTKKGKQS